MQGREYVRMYKKVEIEVENDRMHIELLHEINLNVRDGWKLVECTITDDDAGDMTIHRFEMVFVRE